MNKKLIGTLFLSIILCFVGFFLFFFQANAAVPWLKDHMPYWMWAGKWEGLVAYDVHIWESINDDKLNIDRKDMWLSGVIELDKRQVVDNKVVWRSSNLQEINLDYFVWYRKKREGIVTHSWQLQLPWKIGDLQPVKLSEEYTLLEIDHESNLQVMFLSCLEPFFIEGEYTLFKAEGIDFSWEKEDLYEPIVLIDLQMIQEPLPDPYELLKAENDLFGGPFRDILSGRVKAGRRGDGDTVPNYEIFAWELKPGHDPGSWRQDYKAILEAERAEWVEWWEEIYQRYEEGDDDIPGIYGRAAKRILESQEEWIENLLDDGDRVLDLLLEGKISNFLIRMSERDKSIADAVIQGPAHTIAQIHRHLWSFVPGMHATSIRRFRNSLPSYLQDLYPTSKGLEKVMLLPS